jgi:glycosyltransferase involved in cell wall biosynthesis
MALGRPVVATRVGGIPEVADDGVTATLVPSHNASALASAMVGVLGDTERAERLAGAGRARARGHFSASRMVQRTDALYQGLVGGTT